VNENGGIAGKTVIVIGATSVVGDYLLSMLKRRGAMTIAVSRHAVERSEGPLRWVNSGSHDWLNKISNADFLVNLAPLPLLPDILPLIVQIGVQRIVGIGTTSIYSKKNSPYKQDQEIVQSQAAAEHSLQEICGNLDLDWTVLRPSLVYDGKTDKNIMRIKKFISRFHFVPLASPANGKRQPLHAKDMAKACLSVLETETTRNKSYNIGGGEILTYHKMVKRIFISLGKPAVIVPIPQIILRAMVLMLSNFRQFQDLTPGIIERMNQDMVYNSEAAKRDFGFTARPFEP